MDNLQIVIVLAALGEIVIELAKPLLDPLFSRANLPQDVNPYLYLSTAFGIVLAVLFSANVLAIIGVPMASTGAVVVGVGTTGLIIGRGMNALHDALARLAGRTPGAAR